MGTPYFDLNALIYGQDYSDPLGLNKFLEEERRKKEEEEKQFNLYRWLGLEGPDSPSLMTAFNDAIGVPLGLAKKPVDIIASKMSGLEETRPAEELLTNALFPERLPGDIERTTKPSMDFPLGSPKTESDLVTEEAANEIARRGTSTIGGFGLNPATWMMGAPGMAGKAVTAAFLPGISESLGESAGKGISAVESGDIPGAAGEFTQSLLDAIFLKGMTGHLGRMEPKAATSESRQSEPVTDIEGKLSIPVPEEARLPAKDVMNIEDLVAEPTTPSQEFATRRENITTQFVERMKDIASNVLGRDVKDVGVEFAPGIGTMWYDEKTNRIVLDPAEIWRQNPEKTALDLAHELAHRKGYHQFPLVQSTGEFIKPEGSAVKVPELTAIQLLGNEKFAEVPMEHKAHTAENIPERAKYAVGEHAFQTAWDSIKNHPEFQKLMETYAKNIRNVEAERFKAETGEEPAKSYEENLADIRGVPLEARLPEKVVSEPANILRKILQETKLTKFNKSTLVEELKAKGIDVPPEIATKLPELLGELKDRGWINEKIGGTYSLLIEPPRKTSVGAEKTAPPTDIMTQMQQTLETLPPRETPAKSAKEIADLFDKTQDIHKKVTPEAPTTPDQKVSAKLTIQEIDEVQRILATAVKKGKGKKAELPEELRLAREAAVKALGSERPAKARSEAKPPEGIQTEEVSEGTKPKPEPYEVTLSDGSAHTIRATSPEEATGKVQEILDEYGSTKTVDKVEKKLSSIEKAAKYEIEPTKQGMEEVTDIETGARKAKVEETKLGREEEKLRKAQTKEKFQKKTFKVNLSNGRIATVKARNENIARQMVADRIKRTKSNVTIESVAEKQSSIDEAIQGAARKLEETGWLQSPVAQVLNSIKSIAFGGDVGHLLRQGKQMNADLLFSKHAKKVLDQLPVIFKSAKSEEFFKDFHDKLYADPLIKTMVDNFGLDMPGLGKHFKEEVFHGAGLAEKIPVIGKYYAKPSERAYTAGLNYLRAAEARKFAEKLEKRGFTPENAPEKYRSLARALNIISQRGDFGPAYQKVFSDLSTVYGAPRAKAGRLQNAFELFRGGTSGDIVRTTAAKTLGFNLALFGLLKTVTGAEFIDDPERSDFGKIRIGNNITVDPWMGLGVTARTIAKLQTGKRASPYTGKTYPVSPGEALQDEFLGGIAPGIKLAWEAYSGTDVRGYQVDRWKSLLNVAPLTAKSLAELGSAGGDIEDMLLLSLLQIGGEGVDVFNYDKAREEERRLKIERGIPVSKKKKKVTFNF